MILISHRGNLHGPNPERENDPRYIQEALAAGFDVEIDVWHANGKYRLGHDEPVYETEAEFLRQAGLWCHAKNPEALARMLDDGGIHCFWMENDKVSLTSLNHLWTFTGAPLTSRSIAVLPEQTDYGKLNCRGVCSDYIARYKET